MLHRENFYHILSPLSNYFQIFSISLHVVLLFSLFHKNLQMYKTSRKSKKIKKNTIPNQYKTTTNNSTPNKTHLVLVKYSLHGTIFGIWLVYTA